MATVRLYPSQHAVVNYVQPNYHGTAGSTVTLRNENNVSSTQPRYVCKFDTPEEMRWSRIYSIDLYCYARSITPVTTASGRSYYEAMLYASALKQPFDFTNGTYADISNAGGGSSVCYLNWSSLGDRKVPSYQTAFNSYSSNLAAALRLANNGVFFAYEDYAYTSDNLVIDTATGTNKPYIDVTYIDGTVEITPRNFNPTGGYIDDSKEKPFTWAYKLSYDIIDETGYLAASSFALEWQPEGGSIRTIAATASGVTVPANTFPATGSFTARVKITDPEGRVTYSDWATYTTTEATPSTPTATAPKSTVETAVEPVVFKWQHKIGTDTPQSAAELQYSTDKTTWKPLADVTGPSQSLAVSLENMNAGEIYWRVRTANTDGVFSTWSGIVSFILIAAPPTPIISVDPVPLATISWQATVQQAYRLTIDGDIHAVKFGNASSYTFREPLADGQHTVSVEVQGAYGLWSAPAEAVFTINNHPGGDIILEAESGIDAVLSWQTDDPQDILVYRDGVLIGRASDNGFTDRLAAGEHEYQVINLLPNGNYSRSNTVKATSGSCVPVISEITGSDWLPLNLSANSNQQQVFNWTRTNILRHVSGAVYPVLELSPYEDKEAGYSVAFKDKASAAAFEKLRGKVCIIKSRADEVMVGAITELEKLTSNFFISYNFTLQRIHWEDFTDDSNR